MCENDGRLLNSNFYVKEFRMTITSEGLEQEHDALQLLCDEYAEEHVLCFLGVEN